MMKFNLTIQSINTMNTPTPTEIKDARLKAGLTQTQAAELVEVGLRTWQQWEKGDRKMSKPAFALFNIKRSNILISKELIKELFPNLIDVFPNHSYPGFLMVFYYFKGDDNKKWSIKIDVDTNNKENHEIVEYVDREIKVFNEQQGISLTC